MKALLLLILVFCVGCSPSNDVLSNEEFALSRLQERVTGRWDALVEGDLTGAYGYLSPAYRKLHDEAIYLSGLGKSVKWVSIKILKVDYTGSDGLANVDIELSYTLDLPGAEGENFSSSVGLVTSEATETWVVVDNEWWLSQSGAAELK